jgi:hypothetical protein
VLAIPGAIVACIVIAGTLVQWRAAKSTKVEELCLDFRKFLGDVIAHGGLNQEKWLTEERRNAETDLVHVNGGVHDRKLRKLVTQALAEYNRAFANAYKTVPHVYGGWGEIDTTSPQEIARQQEESRQRVAQTEHAEKADQLFEKALNRVNKINRFTLPRS